MNLRLITTSLLLSIVFILTFGLMVGMRTDDMGQMSNCPFFGGKTICQMGIFEHLSRFQQAFTGIPTKIVILLSLIALILVLFSIHQINFLLQKQKSRFLYFRKNHDPITIFDAFLLALSDGIIQPKLYA